MATNADDPENSPNKRPKTLTLISPSFSSSSSPRAKSKIEEDINNCGICLWQEGKAVRGWIDCCDHYFCFVCIMEWAKLESRCPMCKRRFGSIRCIPKRDVFPRERIINVPVRDQTTSGPPDPFSQVQCTVCHITSDDHVLLICDLCDSASHTYCVGLGATVPEGDWYCHDCNILKDEHDKEEDEDIPNCDSQSSIPPKCDNHFGKIHELPIENILREAGFREADRSSPMPGASTLRRCRNVHGRIRALRENWNKLQSRSLLFSSNSVVDPNSSSSSSKQNAPQNSSSSNIIPKGNTRDIDKAWRMMDVAKSIEIGKRKTGHALKGPNHPLRKVNIPKESGSVSSKVLASSSIGIDRQNYYMFEKEKPSGIPKFIEDYTANLSTGNSELSFSTNIRNSNQVIICHGNGGNLPQNKFHGAVSSVSIKIDEPSACCASMPFTMNNSRAKQDPCASSSCNLKGKTTKVEKSCHDNKARKDNDAKSEILSLVKLNLKLLSRDKKLEIDTFKEIARLSTHSILAACGIGHPKCGVRSFPSSICSHVDELEKMRRSTLMPSSCRECFFVFVKHVVNTIMFEKVGCP